MGEPAIVIVLIMGVAGAGKTTIGRMLADQLGFAFSDADSFHSAANVEKMRRGDQLDDADRGPWLDAMATAIASWLRDDRNVVLACSALKARYRTKLVLDPARVRVVYLKISRSVAHDRVAHRVDHFMPDDLVESQFNTLEEPDDAITVDASASAEAIVHVISDRL